MAFVLTQVILYLIFLNNLTHILTKCHIKKKRKQQTVIKQKCCKTVTVTILQHQTMQDYNMRNNYLLNLSI